MKYFLLLIPFWSLSLFSAESQTTVPGEGQHTCRAYLHLPEKIEKPIPLVLYQAGSGTYSTESREELSEHVKYLLNAGRLAVISIDKPGLSPDPKKPGEAIINYPAYFQHTQMDLITCARNALNWGILQSQSHFKKEVYFIGHSEGAMVLSRLYAKLTAEKKPIIDQIKILLLSGTPMESIRSVLNQQISDPKRNQEFWKAVQEKDDKKLVTEFGGWASPYLEDILKTESLSDSLKKLAELNPQAGFQFYHGLDDKNVSVKALLEFEKWNHSRLENQLPALSMNARYYNADHHLNLSAGNDMIFALLAYLAD